MTFSKWVIHYIEASGITHTDAVMILDAVIASPENASMVGRWEDSIDVYPPSMLAVLTVSVNRHAVAWIDANCPEAWCRPLFAGDK